MHPKIQTNHILFQSKIFNVVKPNLFELITKDWEQHANEKINYAKHMVSKSLPQRRWQGLFKYLKKKKKKDFLPRVFVL